MEGVRRGAQSQDVAATRTEVDDPPHLLVGEDPESRVHNQEVGVASSGSSAAILPSTRYAIAPSRVRTACASGFATAAPSACSKERSATRALIAASSGPPT